MTQRDEGRGRVAVVTGGASGIGLATATVLAERGWRVVINDLDIQRCKMAAEPIGAEVMAFDVSDEFATEKAIAEIETNFGPVDALMANAGLLQSPMPPEAFALADFDRIIAVNVRGVYISCVAAGRRMAQRGSGGIVSSPGRLRRHVQCPCTPTGLPKRPWSIWRHAWPPNGVGPVCGSMRCLLVTSRRHRCWRPSRAASATQSCRVKQQLWAEWWSPPKSPGPLRSCCRTTPALSPALICRWMPAGWPARTWGPMVGSAPPGD